MNYKKTYTLIIVIAGVLFSYSLTNITTAPTYIVTILLLLLNLHKECRLILLKNESGSVSLLLKRQRQ